VAQRPVLERAKRACDASPDEQSGRAALGTPPSFSLSFFGRHSKEAEMTADGIATNHARAEPTSGHGDGATTKQKDAHQRFLVQCLG